MTTIDVSTLSTPELVALITAAMHEYQRRLAAPQVHCVTAPDKPATIITTPSADEQRFILGCLGLLKKSGFVRAVDRAEYKRLATEYAAWFAQNKYPVDTNKSSSRHWLEFGGYI